MNPCAFPKPFRLHIPNTFPDDVLVDQICPGDYEAVCVGPESDFDTYYLFPEGKRSTDASSQAVIAGQAARNAPQEAAIVVGVRSPYYGLMAGQIRMASHMSQLATSGVRRSLTGVAAAYKGTVDLLFYPRIPPALALMRPDKRRVGRWTFGTVDAVETTILTAPGFGRREQLFSTRRVSGAVAWASGSIAFKFYGYQFIGRISGTDIFATTLLGTFTVGSNVFTSNYEFEGRFDYYVVTATETSLVGPDGDVEAQLLLRDC